jgi:hypothetical protein
MGSLISYFNTLTFNCVDELINSCSGTMYDDSSSEPDNYSWMLLYEIPRILDELRDIRDAKHYNSAWVAALFAKMRLPGAMFLC